jgi:hypothetical protein
MPLNASVWRIGLADEPRGAAAREFTALTTRRVELRRDARDASTDRTTAEHALDDAQRQFKQEKAQHTVMGGPNEPVVAARKLVGKAESALRAAVVRDEDAQAALAHIEGVAARLLDQHGPELLAEIAQDAAAARAEVVHALDAAAVALSAWVEFSLRADLVAHESSNPTIRNRNSQHATLRELAAALTVMAGRLPPAPLGGGQPADHPARVTS